MSQFRSLWFAAAIAAISAGAPAFAQDEGEEDEAETIESFTEEFEVIDGLFPLYRDPENGDLYMEIAADQLDDESQPGVWRDVIAAAIFTAWTFRS